MRSLASLIILLAMVAILFVGCGKPDPEIVTVAVASPPPRAPAECFTADPAWVDVPDADVKRSQAVRINRRNKSNYAYVLGNRSTCRAGLKPLVAANTK